MPGPDVTKNYVRERQISPTACAPGSFRTITRGKGKKKIKLVVCCPRGKQAKGRCKVGMVAQSILKPRKRTKRAR